MQSIQVVTQAGCSHCEAAKNLLRTREMEYEEIHLLHQADKAQALLRLSSQRTMPQVFIDGESIGGFTELAQLISPRH